MSLRWTVFETLRAESNRKAADEATETADALRHWPMCPRTPEAVREVQLKREAWKQAQAIADGLRRKEQAAAYEAASELLRENRKNRRATR
jgi:hypothetical protein